MMIALSLSCDFNMVLLLNNESLQFSNISIRFITHFFVPLAFLLSLSSSIKYAYVLALSAQNYLIIFPPNSPLNKPITSLFLPI